MNQNKKTIEFRPALPADELSSRNFFYSLQEETIFHRFFQKNRLFKHDVLQQQLARLDYKQNMTLIGLVMRGGHKEIMAVGSYAGEEGSEFAEVVFVVREDFQGLGIASYLLEQLESIARENGYKGFVASTLKVNVAMTTVFEKKYPNLRISSGSEVDVTMEMEFEA